MKNATIANLLMSNICSLRDTFNSVHMPFCSCQPLLDLETLHPDTCFNVSGPKEELNSGSYAQKRQITGYQYCLWSPCTVIFHGEFWKKKT